jgi:hypothetical protein
VKSSRRVWLLPLALCACFACAGTETGNPPTRSACGKVVCSPCAPPIVLHVSDAVSGAPVEAVAADGDAAACSVQAADTLCQLDGPPYTTPGLHRIELTAPGHDALSVDVELTPSPPALCCDCGYTPTRVDVTLEPRPGSN